MKIVTTPLCEEIVKLAGISNYVVNKYPDEEDGDLAILLSESKVEMDSIAVKINTPKQVFESIKKVSKIAGNEIDDEKISSFFNDYPLCLKYLNSHFKRDINVKVYSEFLKDIVSETYRKFDRKKRMFYNYSWNDILFQNMKGLRYGWKRTKK